MWEFPTYLNFHVQEIKIGSLSYPISKVNTKWIKDLT